MSTTLYPSDQNSGLINTLAGWGDSLTAGSGGTSYLTQLGWQFSDRLINTYAIGGQTGQQIAARQGGLPVYLTLNGNAFNGTNAVSVTSISTPLLSTAADTATRQISGIVNNVQCVLTRSVVSGAETYTLQPVWGNNVGVAANSRFFPDDGLNTRHHINIFWLGRNNVPSLTGLDTQIDACIAQLARPRRFLVLGVLTATNEASGTPAYNNVQAMNAALASTYGDNYVAMTAPSPSELLQLNYTPSTQDNTDIANGLIPTGMRADSIHLNTTGYGLIALRVAAKLSYFGW